MQSGAFLSAKALPWVSLPMEVSFSDMGPIATMADIGRDSDTAFSTRGVRAGLGLNQQPCPGAASSSPAAAAASTLFFS